MNTRTTRNNTSYSTDKLPLQHLIYSEDQRSPHENDVWRNIAKMWYRICIKALLHQNWVTSTYFQKSLKYNQFKVNFKSCFTHLEFKINKQNELKAREVENSTKLNYNLHNMTMTLHYTGPGTKNVRSPANFYFLRLRNYNDAGSI